MSKDLIPKDVQNLNKIKKMSESEIDEQIRLLANRINARIARVEKSTLANYLPNIANIKKWSREYFSSNKLKNKITGSIMKKRSYLQKLEHYETYDITVKGARKAREKTRKFYEQTTGYKPTNEELDHIGKLMSVIFRDSEGITSTFSDLISSDQSYKWITEHSYMSEEEAKNFMQNLKDFSENAAANNLTSQDIVDFINNYDVSQPDYYIINGVKIDRDTNQLVNNITGELIPGYYYDATSENILGEDELVANVDENDITVPLRTFLRGKYGYD